MVNTAKLSTFIKKSLKEVILWILTLKDSEIQITQLADINGGHISGTINKGKKENLRAMSLMHYLFAIVKLEIN